jgi:hypothetical protein
MGLVVVVVVVFGFSCARAASRIGAAALGNAMFAKPVLKSIRFVCLLLTLVELPNMFGTTYNP